MTTTNLINRLQTAVEAKTCDAMAELACLENDLAATLAEARAKAAARIEAETARIIGSIESNLDALRADIDRMAAASLDRIIGRLTATAESMIADYTGSAAVQPEPITPEPSQEPLPVPAAEPIPTPEPITPEPIRTVAAHAVETQEVGLLPDDDEHDPEAIDDSALLPDDGIPTTSDPDGLHERRGAGRNARYSPVEVPNAGEVYHRRVGRRWEPVRYVG